MIEGIVFIGAVIVAAVELVKHFAPKIKGGLTIVLAASIGLLVALVDTQIGVVDLTIAEGIMAGLAASGAVKIAEEV